jgi:molybdate transport system ATP-binding protein
MDLDVSIKKAVGDFTLKTEFNLSSGRCGVFGASGSGKSTLMHLIAGLIEPDEGAISLNGNLLFESGKKINLNPRQRRIGVVFQHALLFPHLSVRNNLLYGWKRISETQRKVEPDAVIEALNIVGLLGRGVNSLSGGERQRVALGRAILACPQLILMDEPLTGLDRDMKISVIQYMNNIFSEFYIPYIYISHSVWEMQMMTDDVLVFAHGRLLEKTFALSLSGSSLGEGMRG